MFAQFNYFSFSLYLYKRMKLWFWITLIIIIYYIYWYYKLPELTLLQSTLNDFNLSLLLEKQPIIIQDRIKDLESVCNAWFMKIFTKYLTESTSPIDNPIWNINKYKYKLIHPSDDIEVGICSSKLINGIPPQDATLVIIKLKANMILILPYRIHYALMGNANVPIANIHDIITYCLPV